MQIAVWFITAVFSYCFTGINLAIILSRLVYHKDIRTVGSKNPGFTNFKRSFGGGLAWLVFAFDLAKAAIPALVGAILFDSFLGARQLGAAYAGFFGVLGHSFPVYYRFRGGKGFLVCLSALFFLDWRAGLIAAGVLTVLVLTVRIMSVSTLSALAAGAAALPFFGCDPAACVLYAVTVVFVIVRHRKNLVRLFRGEEPKFSFFKKKEKTEKTES